MEIKFTLASFRTYYKIPGRIKLQWCIVEEVYLTRARETKIELRPGVALLGTNLYIDIAQRRFFSKMENVCGISRRTHPAQKTKEGGYVLFSADNGLSVTIDKDYVKDIYYAAVYHEELLETTLF